MAIICEIREIRSEDIDQPVQIWRDDDTGRFFLRSVNEGGFACIDLDVRDLARFFGSDPDEVIASINAGKRSQPLDPTPPTAAQGQSARCVLPQAPTAGLLSEPEAR